MVMKFLGPVTLVNKSGLNRHRPNRAAALCIWTNALD